MNRLLLSSLILAFVFVFAGCISPTDAPETSPEVAVETADWDVFGTAFETSTAVPVETVAASPETYTAGPVRVVGTITEVCQGMGCWMTLQVPDGSNIRVVMPRDENGNYVFTLDRTISGRKTVVEGTLSHSTLAEFEAPMHGDMDGDMNGDAEAGHEGDDHGDDHSGSEMNTPEIQLTASGVLVEKAL